MKLAESKETVETNGHVKSIEFGIKKEDTGKIFEILRSKLYENPIGAICREVSCNARDANREGKKPNKPIEILIRNSWLFAESETVIIFKDEGPGISPDRMGDVFCNYGASTKTNTNKQTGGFGLGAKTPFSYTDTFFIQTIVDKKQYIYTAALNTSGTGEMILLSEDDTEEPNGTSIVIPIEDKDIRTFESECLSSTRFWKVQPIFINFKNNTTSKVSLVEDEKGLYQVYTSKESFNSKLNVTIDDILYSVPKTYLGRLGLNDSPREDYYGSENKLLVLPFNNGELNISANRETLFFDDAVITKLTNRLEKTKELLIKNIETQIDKSENPREALAVAHNLSNNRSIYSLFNINFKNDLKYKGKNLSLVNALTEQIGKHTYSEVFEDRGDFKIELIFQNTGGYRNDRVTVDYHSKLLLYPHTQKIRLILKDSNLKRSINRTIIEDKQYVNMYISPSYYANSKIEDQEKIKKAVKDILDFFGIEFVKYSDIPETIVEKVTRQKTKIGNEITVLTNDFKSTWSKYSLNRSALYTYKGKLFYDHECTEEINKPSIYLVIPRMNPNSGNLEGSNNEFLRLCEFLQIKYQIYVCSQTNEHLFKNNSNMIYFESVLASKEVIEKYSELMDANLFYDIVYKPKSMNSSLMMQFSQYVELRALANQIQQYYFTHLNITKVRSKYSDKIDILKNWRLDIENSVILKALIHYYDHHSSYSSRSTILQEFVKLYPHIK